MAVAALPIAAIWPRAQAWAQAQSPTPPLTPLTPGTLFVAEAVPVDVTAGTVTEARERGLTQGRVAGLRKVLERLVAREDLARVPQLNTTQIIDMVRDFSIANERSSAVRYLADLTVRFNPTAVRRLLREARVPFTETISKPLVVVPVLRDANAAILWAPDNTWHSAWLQVPASGALVSFVTPSGDGQDAATVSPEQALAKNDAALQALAVRHGAGGILVAAATIGADDAVAMTLTEIRADLPPVVLTLTHAAAPGIARGEVIAAAARTAAAAVEENWLRRNRVSFNVTGQMTALVPIADLKEWLAVRERLNSVPLVDRLTMQAMTRDRAQITLYYAGGEEQLRLAMTQYNLALSQQNGVWVIESARAGVAGRVLGRPGGDGAEPASESAEAEPR